MKVRRSASGTSSTGCVVAAERVVELELALTDEVLDVDVLARRDVRRGEADDLPVAPHRLAGGDRGDRHLVPGRDHLGDPHLRAALEPQGRAGRERLLRDRHRVLGVQLDRDVRSGYGCRRRAGERDRNAAIPCGHRPSRYERLPK